MLTIDWTSEEPARAHHQLLAVPRREDDELDELAGRFGQAVLEAAKGARFAGKVGESFAFTRELDDALQHVLIVGVGDGLQKSATLRQVAHDSARQAVRLGCEQLVLDVRGQIGAPTDASAASSIGALIAQGLELGTYAYERFLSEDKRVPVRLARATVVADAPAPSEGTARGQTVAACMMRARDLANGPAELVTPTYLATVAQEIVDGLDDRDVALEVLEREDCEKRGMGCYLAVSQGSDTPPKFIHLSYRPKGTSHGRACLIGKGVTFDSGGYSLKPTEGMLDMKMDMSGAAAVLAAFEGIARLGLPWETHVLVAATENMVNGRAYRLGDVLTASNGKTVEVNNTDAEGRLTLADALVFGSKLEPDFMVDFATLTGACMVALGPRIAGVMSPDDALVQHWLDAASAAGEDMWRLPLPTNLKEQLKSTIADMKNTGERWGGALTAGLFLSEFTEGCQWIHVDIAGPAMAQKAYGATTEGGTGFAVATMIEFLSGEIAQPT